MDDFYRQETIRREKRIKQYSIVALFTIIIAVIPDLTLGIYQVAFFILGITPILLFSFFVRKRNLNLAGTLLLFYITCIIFISNTFYGIEANTAFFYIAEYIILLLVIDPRNKFFLILNHVHIGLSILLSQIFTLNEFKILNVEEKSLLLISNVNIILAILSSLYLFYTYVEENIAKENYLIVMHKRINTKNKVIENAQLNLETFIYRSSHNLQGPIRSIMGLYNISQLEKDPEKLKALIQLTNESAKLLDEELAITAQVFKINQHILNLTHVNLHQFIVDYYNNPDIETTITDISKFNALVDNEMLTEGMHNLHTIFLKLRKNATVFPAFKLEINGNIFLFSYTFESKFIDDKYLNVFFSPFHKDIAYLYDLKSEPYLCRRIMDKLHGDIAIHKISDSIISFTIASKLL